MFRERRENHGLAILRSVRLNRRARRGRCEKTNLRRNTERQAGTEPPVGTSKYGRSDRPFRGSRRPNSPQRLALEVAFS